MGRARGRGPQAELEARRSWHGLLVLEPLAFALVLGSGLLLMRRLGWGLGHARWFGVKLGLVAFLLLPLEAMHASIALLWIGSGLRQTAAPPFAKDLSRGISAQEMILALAVPLLGMALPLLLWLSFVHPF